jgi:hypothetical protein
VGAQNSATLGDLDVFVDGSAESVTSDDRDVGGFGLGPERRGDGSIPARFRIAQTVEAPTLRPMPASSPAMRR